MNLLMPFFDFSAVLIGKLTMYASRILKLGAGGTWPGEVALAVSPELLNRFESKLTRGVILVAGTNGKTTTSLMLKSILAAQGFRVIHNASGANLVNGLASAYINSVSLFGKSAEFDFAVFEIDENSLPLVLKFITPRYVICLNLFRDQLDRYGEVDIIAEKWQKALSKLPKSSTVLLNSDDPQIAYLGKSLKAKTIYFGINAKKKNLNKLEHATDSIFCLNCQKRLSFTEIYFSHIGIWQCKNCGLERPDPAYSTVKSSLPGFYNLYNTVAAYACARELKIDESAIGRVLNNFSPAFGRQEEFRFAGIKIKIFLSKNPAGFNQSIATVRQLKAKNLLILLNDRIPDGKDVSWIWDVDFENIRNLKNIVISGDRVYDLALRLKYAGSEFEVIEDLKRALLKAVSKTKIRETLFILPTYSAMLDVRKILTGKRIL